MPCRSCPSRHFFFLRRSHCHFPLPHTYTSLAQSAVCGFRKGGIHASPRRVCLRATWKDGPVICCHVHDSFPKEFPCSDYDRGRLIEEEGFDAAHEIYFSVSFDHLERIADHDFGEVGGHDRDRSLPGLSKCITIGVVVRNMLSMTVVLTRMKDWRLCRSNKWQVRLEKILKIK